VLIGPNNCGKSAVVSALQVLCSNPTSTYVLRHGAKECKIIVETDSGDRIIWSRKKSGSPKYEINGTLKSCTKSFGCLPFKRTRKRTMFTLENNGRQFSY